MVDGSWFEGMERAVLQILLLSIRIAALLFVTPVFRAAPMPGTAKAALVIGLAAMASMNLDHRAINISSEIVDMVQAASVELVLGATLGLGVSLAFAAFSMAGRILDVQVGFGLAQVFDPTTNRQVSVLDSAFSQAGVLVFLVLNGHHALLRAVAFSVERFPVGSQWHIKDSADAVFAQAGGLFALGFALAAPVVFCVLLVELALGVVARNLPQMNMFVVALPVKIIVGLTALTLWFSGIGGVMTRVYASIETSWGQVLAPTGSVSSQGGR
jgi:flagellar biosynthesis protein FliR